MEPAFLRPDGNGMGSSPTAVTVGQRVPDTVSLWLLVGGYYDDYDLDEGLRTLG
jgi:hypothetical protein